MANTIEISPGRFLQISGYVGSLSGNTFLRIPEGQVNADKSGDNWIISVKMDKLSSAVLSCTISINDNCLVLNSLTLKGKESTFPDVSGKAADITVTLMAGAPKEPLSLILYDGPVENFKKTVIELPAVRSVKLEDFTASVAASFKKARENIAKKLGNEDFELEIEDFEIKIPYVMQMADDDSLIMQLPSPGKTVDSDELMYSKLRFRKTIKMT